MPNSLQSGILGVSYLLAAGSLVLPDAHGALLASLASSFESCQGLVLPNSSCVDVCHGDGYWSLLREFAMAAPLTTEHCSYVLLLPYTFPELLCLQPW